MEKRMLVNVLEPEESRIAIVEDGQLEELYIERAQTDDVVGNIYKARVANIESSLQAAFVEFGWRRQGFLHASDINPRWYAQNNKKAAKGNGNAPPPIQEVLKKGTELMVQVTKAGIRNKAPAVTTHISLPGRCLVLMPHSSTRRGVSRKIESEEERERLRDLLDQMDVPEGFGIIARTAAEGRNKRELQRDLNYLLRLYRAVEKQFKAEREPGLLYEESDLVIRAVRDVFSTDIDKMLVDSETEYRKILEFMKVTMPSYRRRVSLYTKDAPLFHKHGVEDQIEQIHQKRVGLPSGGSIVIEQTEALVAIDVNSGRFKRENDAEESAFQLDQEAAREIARQIRLRDMGGVIIIDFVDLYEEEHKREVERVLWESLKRDRARTKMLRMSKFGIVEMTRQRVRRNIESASYSACPACAGSGQVLTLESMALSTFRRLRAALRSDNIERVEVSAASSVAQYLLNRKRREIIDLEERHDSSVEILGVPTYAVDKADIKCYTKQNKLVKR